MKKIPLILMLTFVSLFFSQKSEAQTIQNQTSAKINHVAMYVTNLNKTVNFYQSLFNFPLLDEPFKDGKHAWLSLGGPIQMHLIEENLQKKAEHLKSDHLCFSVHSLDDVMNKLKQQKIDFSNWEGAPNIHTVRIDGVKQIFLQDPDGHWLEVNDAK